MQGGPARSWMTFMMSRILEDVTKWGASSIVAAAQKQQQQGIAVEGVGGLRTKAEAGAEKEGSKEAACPTPPIQAKAEGAHERAAGSMDVDAADGLAGGEGPPEAGGYTFKQMQAVVSAAQAAQQQQQPPQQQLPLSKTGHPCPITVPLLPHTDSNAPPLLPTPVGECV
ncbi:hypothetical protein DUNSADRAFT_2865 [Dunaliella salina]|uniref:Encoded protein n=1 Tax=Dunaliella salina TaxID=3046 RepID=A0ABQ7FVW1_DUNSA|nr:hypothetical protein DUNSADRAFT_2865 [Dunaliella salina]|eukprot:KAF5826514.1 hypothetical protein DUNSADRAFT_2865 [Dunaliella salina]